MQSTVATLSVLPTVPHPALPSSSCKVVVATQDQTLSTPVPSYPVLANTKVWFVPQRASRETCSSGNGLAQVFGRAMMVSGA